ncbi:GIMA7 GTPase, partial [Amia calva]|nr:GIMA7 GTPase [Amia calva]
MDDNHRRVEEEMMVQLCSPGPHAVVIVISLDPSDLSLLGKFFFLEKFKKTFGEVLFRHAVMLFTHGDRLRGRTVEQYIEKQAEEQRKQNLGPERRAQNQREYLQRLMEECGNRCCVFNNKNTSDHRQVTELLETMEAMMRENGGAHYTFGRYQRILPSIAGGEEDETG